jgi:hypothetical protein
MLKTMLILLRLSMTAQAPEKDPPPSPSEGVTYVDFSGPGPSEPESDLPEITKKGAL